MNSRQLLITTPSGSLFSALADQPEAIIACERLGPVAECRRVDPEQPHIWLEEYSSGNLWRMGELGADP